MTSGEVRPRPGRRPTGSRLGRALAAFLLAIVPSAHAVSTHSTAIDVTPDETEVWVVNPDHGTVGVISTTGGTENTLIAEVAVGREPWCLDIHPTNGEVWVTSLLDDAVYVIDGPSRTVIDTISTGYETFGVAFAPDGLTALVTVSGADRIHEIDVATRTITRSLDVPRRPRGIAWRPDGERAWVTHLLMPLFFGQMTEVFPSTWTTSNILLRQVFGTNRAGYPSTMQNVTLLPAPADTMLWLPTNLINTTTGALLGNPLTPTNIFHAAIRPIDVGSSTDLYNDTYFMSEGGSPNLGYSGGTTPVGGPIAVDFKGGRGFVVNLHSENVTVVDGNILNPAEYAVIPVGKAPIGIVTLNTRSRAFVANWLSRNVTVILTGANVVVATVPSTSSPEPLSGSILHGKQLFFSSKGDLAFEERGACASCHVWGRHDARPWDLSQFGKHLRATPDIRGIGFTGAHDWAADKDEFADHNFGIIDFTGGPGLIPSPNPPLGAPNAGLSQAMDDMSQFMASQVHRTDTPFLAPGGGLTAEADSGQTLFNDPSVGCALCHVPPFYTDSDLFADPFILHDVGTAVVADTQAVNGFDTPSLCGVWDTGPYLHHHPGSGGITLRDVMTTYNPNDLHGTTSQLSSTQIDYLVAFLQSIAWPGSTGTAVAAPELAGESRDDRLEAIYPNPFGERTSMRFSVERNAAEVRIDVVDVQGRRVRALLDRPMARGSHHVGWDSRDESGRRVAPGVYFARLTVDGGRAGEKKMVVVR